MKEIRGLDIDKLAYGMRIAVIDDLIKDLEALKIKVIEVDREAFLKKLSKIIR